MYKGKYFGFLGAVVFLIFTPSLFSQNFNRVIELRNPTRMNGQDILALQNRLLSLGFSEVGDADGYFGPLTEGVIRSIQTFNGFESNGKVDSTLWNFIFNDNDALFIQIMNIVFSYNKNQLLRETERGLYNLLYGEHSGEHFANDFYYSSKDKKLKIFEGGYHSGANYSNWGTSVECYFVNDVYYFIKYSHSEWEWDSNYESQYVTMEENKLFLVYGNKLFEIENGVLKLSSYEGDIVERINYEIKLFNEAINKK